MRASYSAICKVKVTRENEEALLAAILVMEDLISSITDDQAGVSVQLDGRSQATFTVSDLTPDHWIELKKQVYCLTKGQGSGEYLQQLIRRVESIRSSNAELIFSFETGRDNPRKFPGWVGRALKGGAAFALGVFVTTWALWQEPEQSEHTYIARQDDIEEKFAGGDFHLSPNSELTVLDDERVLALADGVVKVDFAPHGSDDPWITKAGPTSIHPFGTSIEVVYHESTKYTEVRVIKDSVKVERENCSIKVPEGLSVKTRVAEKHAKGCGIWVSDGTMVCTNQDRECTVNRGRSTPGWYDKRPPQPSPANADVPAPPLFEPAQLTALLASAQQFEESKNYEEAVKLYRDVLEAARGNESWAEYEQVTTTAKIGLVRVLDVAHLHLTKTREEQVELRREIIQVGAGIPEVAEIVRNSRSIIELEAAEP